MTCPDCQRSAPAQAWHPLAGIEWMRDEGAGTIDVVLPLERAPRFPDLCVACGEEPSQRLTLVIRASRGGDWLRVWGGGGRRLRLEVPCCERCAGRVRWLPRLRTGLGWLVFLGAGLATLVIARERGARVFGVSADDVASHAAFKAKYRLDFPLLADVDHALSDAVGVWGPQTVRGHTFEGIARTTFIVRDGIVTEVFEDVSVMGHAERLLAAL